MGLEQTRKAFLEAYSGRRALVTGHTGFKGSWLCAWLEEAGCAVTGYSLDLPTDPAHFSLLNVRVRDLRGDVNDFPTLSQAISQAKPDIIFHLAAQPLVRLSYAQPRQTLATNIMGTVNVLEACRHISNVAAVVIITSDKCYDNREWVWGYRENDPMGGHDAYSASKGCAELVTASYRRSFFPPLQYGQKHKTLAASVRSGNVIGGGDWAEDRILPDMIRALEGKKPAHIRDPGAIRPWQHVLDPLAGYLMLGARLLAGETPFADAWNFGPSPDDCCTVHELATKVSRCWPSLKFSLGSREGPHEATYLALDSSKARRLLGWSPTWRLDQAVERSVSWYRRYLETGVVATHDDIAAFQSTLRGY